jgi:hypothetical protein
MPFSLLRLDFSDASSLRQFHEDYNSTIINSIEMSIDNNDWIEEDVSKVVKEPVFYLGDELDSRIYHFLLFS